VLLPPCAAATAGVGLHVDTTRNLQDYATDDEKGNAVLYLAWCLVLLRKQVGVDDLTYRFEVSRQGIRPFVRCKIEWTVRFGTRPIQQINMTTVITAINISSSCNSSQKDWTTEIPTAQQRLSAPAPSRPQSYISLR